MRKKREMERRQKTLQKYVQRVEEQQKLDAEVKAKLVQDKLLKHQAALDKIQKHQEERKAQIAEAEKAYKEINKQKPLYLKVQERFDQETESAQLAKQKKALEDKRNFVNQVPAGGFKNAFVEHEVSYRQLKEERES